MLQYKERFFSIYFVLFYLITAP